ncbi:hypothetical protein PR048_026196 [Dryococelus australis]|uniref:Uncharacterized protein n=1 Tax=Dryococelus australis TaxID=614101 RepID=A0ABQ9GKP0_9NEOP|nr:hypothetical protein PR048_026196 [Dryococelus australis]
MPGKITPRAGGLEEVRQSHGRRALRTSQALFLWGCLKSSVYSGLRPDTRAVLPDWGGGQAFMKRCNMVSTTNDASLHVKDCSYQVLLSPVYSVHRKMHFLCNVSHSLFTVPSHIFFLWAVVAERLARSPPIKANWIHSPAGEKKERYNNLNNIEATVAERLARSPSTKANRVQSPAGSPDFRKWESYRTMPLTSGFSRGSPVSSAPSFLRCSIFTSIILIGSQYLAVKSRPNLFTHSTLSSVSTSHAAPSTATIVSVANIAYTTRYS